MRYIKKYIAGISFLCIIFSCINFGQIVEATENNENLYAIDKYKLNLEDNEIKIPFIKNSEVNDKILSGHVNYLTINKIFEEYLNGQEGKLHIISDGNKFVNATMEEVRKHADINYFSQMSDYFQFLELNKYRDISTIKLNEFFLDLPIKHGNINIYINKAENFKNAAKMYSIDPLYLVAHTLIETGNGNSQLAQGNYILLGENGEAIRDENENVILADRNVSSNRKVKVYNFFGIGAIDSDPLIGGVTYAYNNGWTSIEKTIEGSARWISENYINASNSKFKNQNTLYAMKWDFTNAWHQYATDVQWPTKIARNIYRLAYMYEGNSLSFEVPLYSDINVIPTSFRQNNKLYYANSTINLYDYNNKLKGHFNSGNEVYIYGTTSDNENLITMKDEKILLIPDAYKDKLLDSLFIWKVDEQGYYNLINSVTNQKVYSWFEFYDQMYYFNDNGQMQIGWKYLGENYYYFADNGYMQTGWQYLGESYYYFADNGYMQTGWQYLGDSQYYFADNGYMQTGWQYLDGNYYYFADNGYMQTGWQYLGESQYYFADNGCMEIGWEIIDGKQYYFADNGYMQTGWQYLGGGWFYFYEDGSMATNTMVDGFEIGENGYSNKI